MYLYGVVLVGKCGGRPPRCPEGGLGPAGLLGAAGGLARDLGPAGSLGLTGSLRSRLEGVGGST